MFTSFFYLLRARGLKVSLNEWMSLIEALDKGLHHSSFTGFYYLCRAILVKSEADFDKFDGAFLEYFKDMERATDGFPTAVSRIISGLTCMQKAMRSLWAMGRR